jgi:hypothetical protein
LKKFFPFGVGFSSFERHCHKFSASPSGIGEIVPDSYALERGFVGADFSSNA